MDRGRVRAGVFVIQAWVEPCDEAHLRLRMSSQPSLRSLERHAYTASIDELVARLSEWMRLLSDDVSGNGSAGA